MTSAIPLTPEADLKSRLSRRIVQRRWSAVTDAADFVVEYPSVGVHTVGQESMIEQWKRLIEVMTLELTFLYEEYARGVPTTDPALFEGPELLAQSSLDRVQSMTSMKFAAEEVYVDANEE